MNTNPRTLDTEKTINDDFELRDLAIGATLCGKYRLELEAGKGGMGVVWKAWDAIGERWVALKFLPQEIRHSESAMEQVKSAFHTVQALNHPNICPVYGLEKDPAFGYFVVKKWLEGQPLSALQLPREEILPVLEKVAAALDYAHSEKVIHRDVKPSNIFIGTDGKVTLIDFGIAANLHSENQAMQGQFASSGTEKYMAPEQRSGQLQTAQTDEYALALVAMELFAGSLSPLAFRKVAPEIQDVLETTLADKPAERFVTCREFVRALSRATDEASKSNPTPEVKSNSLEAIVALERLEAEEEQRAEEEKLAARIKRLEEKIQALYRNKQYEEAILDLEVLLKFQPNDQNALFLLRMCEKRLEERKRIIQEQINLENREKARRIEVEQARQETEVKEEVKSEELDRAAKAVNGCLGIIIGFLCTCFAGWLIAWGMDTQHHAGVVFGVLALLVGCALMFFYGFFYQEKIQAEQKKPKPEESGQAKKTGILSVFAILLGCFLFLTGFLDFWYGYIGEGIFSWVVGFLYFALGNPWLRSRFGRR